MNMFIEYVIRHHDNNDNNNDNNDNIHHYTNSCTMNIIWCLIKAS